MKFFRILFLLLCCFGYAANAQINLNDTLSVDPNVRIGKLSNGLTYYIRNNKKPEQKVELRLVVNAGSILEDDDQQGIAHLCEHMAFNGTTHFKKNDIVSFLQSIGVEFGNDLNAGTSFDETTYILPIPTPHVVFVDTLYKVVYRNNPLAPVAIPKPENFDQIDFPRLMQIYKERFGNAYGMHFTFVGSLSENEL